MPPKSRAKTRVPLRQGSLGVEQHALLKKPLDHLGKQIEMPGSFWKGRMSADERETVYKCTIIDFSLAIGCLPGYGAQLWNALLQRSVLDLNPTLVLALFRGQGDRRIWMGLERCRGMISMIRIVMRLSTVIMIMISDS